MNSAAISMTVSRAARTKAIASTWPCVLAARMIAEEIAPGGQQGYRQREDDDVVLMAGLGRLGSRDGECAAGTRKHHVESDQQQDNTPGSLQRGERYPELGQD